VTTAQAPIRQSLSSDQVEAMLARLGLDGPPAASEEGVGDLYRAWCRTVPFDNVLRRVQIGREQGERLPGWTPNEFVGAHLAHGAGGFCVPASAALAALLRALGFSARIMLAAIEVMPDHATVAVTLDEGVFLLDTVILGEVPIPLPIRGRRRVGGGLHGVTVQRENRRWRIDYAAAMTRAPATCTVSPREADVAACEALYRATQASPVFKGFNQGLYVRRNSRTGISIVYRDRYVFVDHRGSHERQVDPAERARILVERFDLSEEIVARIPEDRV
jgi:N-hydroxyarylamine O-acetyltransferase